VISYVEDFASFFNGDKAGLTGAIDLCDLTTSSIGLWKEGYDYFQGMFEGVSTGFFGKLAQRNVMIAGLASNILGFASTLMTANNGADGKSWQSIVADYVESGKDLFLQHRRSPFREYQLHRYSQAFFLRLTVLAAKKENHHFRQLFGKASQTFQ